MSMPPIVGTPPPPIDSRPTCPGCSQPRRPLFFSIWDKTPGNMHITGREWRGEYHGYGSFCTLRCATGYAEWMFKTHGTRLRRVAPTADIADDAGSAA
jgi:hypothetical protein